MPPSRSAVTTPGVPRNQSLERAVAILRAVALASEPTTTTEIAAAVELPRATTGRMLATLADAGLVDRPAGAQGWVLGYEATRLGRAADPYGVLTRRAQAPLEELTAATGESSVLAVTRVPLDVEIVSQVDAPNLLRPTSWIGRRFGLHASVSGKLAYARLAPELREALLADQRFERYTEHTIVDPERFRVEIGRVGRDGHARSIDELELGLTMIGVDVPSGNPRASVASVGIMGPTARIVPRLDRVLAAVRDSARALSGVEW